MIIIGGWGGGEVADEYENGSIQITDNLKISKRKVSVLIELTTGGFKNIQTSTNDQYKNKHGYSLVKL